MDPRTTVQWLWIDIGHTQIAKHILELGDSPAINLSDDKFYTYFNWRYLGTKPFQHLQLPNGQKTSMNSTTHMSEILRWAKAGRSGAGASDAVGISDIGAYFNAVVLPLMLVQNGIKKELSCRFRDDINRVIVAPMASTWDMADLHNYLGNAHGARIQPTLYMVVINLSSVLSRYWLQQSQLLDSERSILLDILPGIERSQMYGPPTDSHNIKDCLTTAEFNLGNALSAHYNKDVERQRDKISIPITNVDASGLTQLTKGYVYLNLVFQEMTDYIPNCIIVWTSHNCRDIASRRKGHSGSLTDIEFNDNSEEIGNIGDNSDEDNDPFDADYKLKKRDDKKTCNAVMLQSNAILAKMLYKKMKTCGELKRYEIIRSPLFTILEKNRGNKKRNIYRRYCGSASYHYITNTERYRANIVSRQPPKVTAAEDTMIQQLSEQLARSQL